MGAARRDERANESVSSSARVRLLRAPAGLAPVPAGQSLAAALSAAPWLPATATLPWELLRKRERHGIGQWKRARRGSGSAARGDASHESAKYTYARAKCEDRRAKFESEGTKYKCEREGSLAVARSVAGGVRAAHHSHSHSHSHPHSHSRSHSRSHFHSPHCQFQFQSQSRSRPLHRCPFRSRSSGGVRAQWRDHSWPVEAAVGNTTGCPHPSARR